MLTRGLSVTICHMFKKNYRYYDVILAFFAAMLLISNLGATKLIAIGPIITDGGAILFPLIYIFSDILTEVYGYKYARRAIWTAFGVMLLAVWYRSRSCATCPRLWSTQTKRHLRLC